MPIPIKRERRKLPLMCFQKALNCPLNKSFTASPLMAASDPTKSSYMPIMKAIVPPETPGMTSAAPIQAPLTATIMFFKNPFITLHFFGYLIFVRNSFIAANICLASERRSSVGLPDMTISYEWPGNPHLPILNLAFAHLLRNSIGKSPLSTIDMKRSLCS